MGGQFFLVSTHVPRVVNGGVRWHALSGLAISVSRADFCGCMAVARDSLFVLA
jgi:hypothetical protein